MIEDNFEWAKTVIDTWVGCEYTFVCVCVCVCVCVYVCRERLCPCIFNSQEMAFKERAWKILSTA